MISLSINGIPSCANKRLLTDILRQDWGYKGFVISDDSAVEYIYTEHHYTDSFTKAAVAAIKAGCNVELVGKFNPAFWMLQQGIDNHLITEDEVRENVKPVLYTRMRLGEFDPPAMNPYSRIEMSEVLSEAHLELAVRAAIKSFVLMKNVNRLLPITKPYHQIAVIPIM